MKPVVVFRHVLCEGAGYLGEFLDRHHIPWCEVRIDLGEALPDSVLDYSGLVWMGGTMSVNDDLPWMAAAMQLIRDAIAQDIPVLGHCLGGQLISKALGADITSNPIKELGWGDVTIMDNPQAKQWFGDMQQFVSFHWHGETFSLPDGAQLLMSSPYCQHQAWSMGKHFAMQCHIEMTAEMVKVWSEVGQQEIQDALDSPAVEDAQHMIAACEMLIPALNHVADQVYGQWIKGLSA